MADEKNVDIALSTVLMKWKFIAQCCWLLDLSFSFSPLSKNEMMKYYGLESVSELDEDECTYWIRIELEKKTPRKIHSIVTFSIIE